MKEFDFETIGKRTPYRTPEGFFPKMEEEVMSRVSKGKHRLRLRITIGISTLIGAAAVALLLLLPGKQPTQTITNKAVTNLTAQVGKIAQPTPSTTKQTTRPLAQAEAPKQASIIGSTSTTKTTTPRATATDNSSTTDMSHWTDEEVDNVVAMVQADPFMDSNSDY